jgi:galactonate dehydratase
VKIINIETFLVPPRWMFCRIATDEGVVGWGEPVVEGNAEAVRAAVDVLAETLLGADPLRVEDNWQVMTKAGFYRGGPVLSSAVAGLDQALWDIAGKTYGAPVHALLGGHVRDRVPVYSWIGGDEPAELAEAAAAQVEAGLTAVKMNGSGAMTPIATSREVADLIKRAETVREAIGPDRHFAIDFHGRVTTPNARRILPLLEEVAPMFVEEPVLPEHVGNLSGLVASSSIPLAVGERLYSRSEFRPALEAGVAVVQPDLSHAGGISEVRRIAAMAEVWNAHLAPHCPLGPISLAASLQVAFATPNFLIQEQSLGIHYNKGGDLLDYLADTSTLQFVNGCVERPLGPGLGIEVDEEAVRRADAIGHKWRSPLWRHPDGSFAEW